MLEKLEPTVLVIFGITGDLAKRKVLPAIYNLVKAELLDENSRIIGISRQALSTDEMVEKLNLCVLEKNQTCDPIVLQRFRQIFEMFQLDPLETNDYINLKKHLAKLDANFKTCATKLIYLSIPPQVYNPIIKKIGEVNLNNDCTEHQTKHLRLLVEKPFGHDYLSAIKLIEDTEAVFSEDQIFRIDHYLAKDAAQNILHFRHHNPVFNQQWNSNYISHIHVLAKEEIGIENRINFYEQVGALRDLIQSHLIQILSLVGMDLPSEITANEVHAQKTKFIESLSIYKNEHLSLDKTVIRGQYHSYSSEVNNPNSQIETFASVLLNSNLPLWQNTSFQLTTGKALNKKETLIKIYFGHNQFNILHLRIQPDEGFDLNLKIENPGFNKNLTNVKMNFSYNQLFDNSYDAYEKVLVDAIKGDHLLFANKNEVLASWRLFQPILDNWAANRSILHIYDNNSDGPSLNKLAINFNDLN